MEKPKYPNLAAEIVKNGDTNKSIANLIGINYNALWRRLTGRTDWSITEIEKICNYYKKTFEELFKR